MRASKDNPQGVSPWYTQKFDENLPLGSYLITKINPRVPGDRPLRAIGYNYISRKVLGFIATEGHGISEPGVPYLSCLPDNYDDVSISPLFILICLAGISMPVIK